MDNMAEMFPIIISAEEQVDEDYLTRGERLRQSFALNGGKYAFYDGGSALMTYRDSEPDGGKAMHAEAVKSMASLREELKLADLDNG